MHLARINGLERKRITRVVHVTPPKRIEFRYRAEETTITRRKIAPDSRQAGCTLPHAVHTFRGTSYGMDAAKEFPHRARYGTTTFASPNFAIRATDMSPGQLPRGVSPFGDPTLRDNSQPAHKSNEIDASDTRVPHILSWRDNRADLRHTRGTQLIFRTEPGMRNPEPSSFSSGCARSQMVNRITS